MESLREGKAEESSWSYSLSLSRRRVQASGGRMDGWDGVV